MTVITMSRKELARLQVMIDLSDGRYSVEQAAELMGVGRRQVYRLRDAFRIHGPEALVSKKRGKRSNRAYGATFRKTVLNLVRNNYVDFGPTLAAEKIMERHGLWVAVETLRQWMIEDGLWVKRRDRRKVHQPRNRRDCLGELIQLDGSEHHWFEDRGEMCTLLVFVDDATSRLMHLKFVPSESTFAYFQSAREYLETHGKPIAFYSDKHSVFRVNKEDAANGENMTQFGRAMHELNIDILCANSSQAKGRVERANKTLQDRLVKELRLQGICDIETANAFLPQFMESYNTKFAKPPRLDKDLHRPLAPLDNLDFAWRVERTVTYSLTVQYDRVMFLLEQNDYTRQLVRKKVEIHDFSDGRIEIRHDGRTLPYRTFDRIRRVDQGAVVENKRLTEALEYCKQLQEQLPPIKRSRKAPTRSAQNAHMFPAE